MKLSIPVSLCPNGLVVIESDDMFRDSPDNAASFAALMAASPALTYVVEYGWKQSLGDATALPKDQRVGMTPDKYLALVAKKRDNILNGTIRSRGVATGPKDPIAVESERIAKLQWAAHGDASKAAAIGKYRAVYFDESATDETVTARILADMAASDAIRSKAADAVAKSNAKALDPEMVAEAANILASLVAA